MVKSCLPHYGVSDLFARDENSKRYSKFLYEPSVSQCCTDEIYDHDDPKPVREKIGYVSCLSVSKLSCFCP